MNGVVTALRAGTLFYYDQSTAIEISSHERWPMDKYFVCLSGLPASTRLRSLGLRAGTSVQLAMFPEVQRVIDELIKEGQHHRTATGRICAALTEVLLLRIEDLVGLSGSSGRVAEATFSRCKSVIDVQATQLNKLCDIIQAVRLESTQLNRLFRRYQGISPYQYLLRRKMTLAAERLREPGTLVKEAAAYVGFSDPYHFSRCFKKIHRISPKKFQDAWQRPEYPRKEG